VHIPDDGMRAVGVRRKSAVPSGLLSSTITLAAQTAVANTSVCAAITGEGVDSALAITRRNQRQIRRTISESASLGSGPSAVAARQGVAERLRMHSTASDLAHSTTVEAA